MPVRNAATTIGGQLRALAEQDAPPSWELVVADNGSTDGTPELTRSLSARIPGFRLVVAGGPAGVSHARNVGAAHASGAVLVFCDADDEADPAWVSAIGEAARTHGIFGGALDRRRFTAPARRRPGLELSTGLSRPFPGYLPFASGANLAVRSDVFRDLGGFDESFVGGGDDVDFCWRAQQAGYELGFAPRAVMHYRERATAVAAARQFFRYGVQDPHLYKKHRRCGMPRSSARTVVSTWAGLTIGGIRFLPTAARRAQWTRSSSRRLGRVVGSVRYRALFL